MKKDIEQVVKHKTWERMNYNYSSTGPDGKPLRFLKGTWSFKWKHLPDVSPLKYKARCCVSKDIQKAGVELFETYSPVFQWSAITLALTMILSNNWHTKQVDYTNAFYQEDLKEEVCIDPPCSRDPHQDLSDFLYSGNIN